MGTVTAFIFLGSKITADGDCSHEIKRHLLLGRKTMTNLDSMLKNKDITLSTKVHLVKAMVFPVVMYGCESWTIEKAEYQRIDAFELWCCRRLLRVPWTARRSNQSILKEISPGCSLEGLMLRLNSNTLATWCEELTHWKRPWCWEGLRAGGEGDDRGWDGWMASPTRWTWVWARFESWWRTGKPGVLQSMGLQRVNMTEWLKNSNSWWEGSCWKGGCRKSLPPSVSPPLLPACMSQGRATWGPNEKTAVCPPGRSLSSGTKSAGTLILNFPASRSVRNKRLLFKPPSLCYFVIAARANWCQKASPASWFYWHGLETAEIIW